MIPTNLEARYRQIVRELATWAADEIPMVPTPGSRLARCRVLRERLSVIATDEAMAIFRTDPSSPGPRTASP